MRRAQNRPTNTKQRQDAFTHLDVHDNQIGALRHGYEATKKELKNFERVIDAIIELVGVSAVQEKIRELRIKEMEAGADNDDKLLAETVARGEMRPIEAIRIPKEDGAEETCYVVLQQTGKDGSIRHPSRIHVQIKAVETEVQAQLEGKKLGEEITLPSEDVVKVLGIYEVVPVEERPVPDQTDASLEAAVEPVSEAAPIPTVEGQSEQPSETTAGA